MILVKGRRREWMTDMFRALELRMKAEARTRRAVEKCILERWMFLSLGGGGLCLGVWKAGGEVVVE